MEQINAFTFASREFFETIDRYPIALAYVDHLKGLLPDGWTLHRHGVWVGATNGADGATQGFKIHVSSVPKHATRVLDLVVPECVRNGVSFKIAGDPNLLNFLNSKRYSRGHSGKFMTLYPRDLETFKELIQTLYERTSTEDVAGPYILSDRRFKDSKVLFYRYGGFKRVGMLQADGSTQPVIQSPAGDLVPDQRLPYFSLPEWMEDPFGGSRELEYEGGRTLKERYDIESVLAFSNAGGVYAGTDLETGRSIIIKEARPLTGNWMTGNLFLDAVSLLEREHRILERLRHLDSVPEPIDIFTLWEHTFLVQERIEGPTFQQYWASNENILAPFVQRENRIQAFVPKFKKFASSLITVVEQVHDSGVILADVSPHNVLVDPETLRLSLIDFESALIPEEDRDFMAFARQWVTPGFSHPERAIRDDVRYEDDIYGIGMLLYSTVVPAQAFFQLSPDARDLFLQEYIRMGVPLEVKAVIDNLLNGSTEAAKGVLSAWHG